MAFVSLAFAVAGGPLPVDLSVAAALRPLDGGAASAVIAAFNLLGQAPVWDSLLVVAAVVLWMRGQRAEAVVLVVGVLAAEAGASMAKLIVDRARPPGIVVQDLLTQASYPSGHMTRAVVTTGLLVAMAWRWPGVRAPAVAAAITFSAAMGVARIAAGEHWFTDVVGATLFGAFGLAVIGLAAGAIRPWWERRFPLSR